MTITSDVNKITKLRPYLPQSISHALSRLDKSVHDSINEIRLHAGGATYITIDGKNCVLSSSGISAGCRGGICVTSEEIEDFIYKFCKGSVYCHEDTLGEFYITNEGIRAGLAGEAVYKNGILKSVGKITSVNIRIPRHINGCSDELVSHIEQNGFADGKGILVISSPGVGKTTLLRDLALKLSCSPENISGREIMRVTVIDERKEIFIEKLFSECCIDFLSGVDKLKGIEIASRVLSPQIIICDEIASPEEAEKITRQKNSGIVFIASIHADSIEDVLKKDYVRRMFENNVFGIIYRLYRNGRKVCGEISRYRDDD